MADPSSKAHAITAALIAPCGMNCRLCRAYARDRQPCPGCRGSDRAKSKVRVACQIKNCEQLVNAGLTYCGECHACPCTRLQHLDARYRTKYGMSMIENLENIRESGIRHFLRAERERWACPECGAIICVHLPQCRSCGHKWRGEP
jgi:hypothetical protein